MRIVIAGQGDGAELTTWSGVPHHLGLAFEHLGAEVVHLDANPPRRIRRPAIGLLRAAGVRQPGASHGPELAWMRTQWVARELRRIGHADVVQLNTGVRLPPGSRYVTLHDLTVPQAMGVGWSDPALMSSRRAAAWMRRERMILHGAIGCCTASDWSAASVIGDHGVPAERVHTVGFGCNVVPQRRSGSWEVPRFLFVSRAWERKNGPLVLRAFRRVRERRPDATLTLVGVHPAIDEPGVRDAGPLRTLSPEDRDAVVQLYEESTCFVQPSLMEPFGIAYLEAGAAGIPSIGTRVGGAATAIGDGGVLVDPHDEDELFTAMAGLADPATAARLGALAAANAERYTWERVAERMLGVLRDQPIATR